MQNVPLFYKLWCSCFSRIKDFIITSLKVLTLIRFLYSYIFHTFTIAKHSFYLHYWNSPSVCCYLITELHSIKTLYKNYNIEKIRTTSFLHRFALQKVKRMDRFSRYWLHVTIETYWKNLPLCQIHPINQSCPFNFATVTWIQLRQNTCSCNRKGTKITVTEHI